MSAPAARADGGGLDVSAPPLIVVVEGDPEVGTPIVEQLVADGYRAGLAHTAQHFRVLASGAPPALVVLGCLHPPPRGALDLLSRIRDGESGCPADLPVIVLGTPAHQLDLLRAFAAGADDFLARPGQPGFNHLELRARLQALLRRVATTPAAAVPANLLVGPLSIDTGSRSVRLHRQPIRLRPREIRAARASRA
jgi:DNA-binding response OmpR family regulator